LGLRPARAAINTAPPSAWAAFKAEARQIKKRHRLDVATDRAAHQGNGSHAPPATLAEPLHPMESSRAALWAWYKRSGKSWLQFIHDHGAG
jgi:hypothetical protein